LRALCSRGYLKGLVLLQLVRALRESILGFIEAFVNSLHHTSKSGGSLTPEAAPESRNASTKTTTGVPNKSYRGAQQGSPYASRPLTLLRPANKPETRPIRPCDTPPATYRGAQQELPGCPTRTTGVPNKSYRGAQQELPGCPTKTTGAPNKWPSLKLLQNRVFCVVFRGPFVFVYLVVLCC
jgi:hypothetical protein